MDDATLFDPLEQAQKEAVSKSLVVEPISYWSDVWRRLKANKAALFGLITLSILMMLAIFAPLFSPYTYYETKLQLKNLPPNAQFWFGTDELGRDLFTRCWWGARISLFVGISASLIDLTIGVLYGAFAALRGGKVDEWMMRTADILYAIPYLLVDLCRTMWSSARARSYGSSRGRTCPASPRISGRRR